MLLLLLLRICLLCLFQPIWGFVSRVLSSRSELLRVDIPFPTGLLLTERLESGNVYCLLQHWVLGIPDRLKAVYEIDAVPSAFCKQIIANAEDYASRLGGWHTTRHEYLTTTDLHIDDVFGKQSKLHELIDEKILPELAQRFGLRREWLRLGDGYVVKWDSNLLGGKRGGLEPHLDRVPFSFVVALNDPSTEFVGGGTRFIEDDVTVRPKCAGIAVAFCGKNRHEGIPVTEGCRYILTGFCTYQPREGPELYDHEAFLEDADAIYDGSAAFAHSSVLLDEHGSWQESNAHSKGIHIADLLRGVFLPPTETGPERLVLLTADTTESQVQALFKECGPAVLDGRHNVSVLVERDTGQLGEDFSKGSSALEELARIHKLRPEILARGWFWFVDGAM